MFKCVKFLETRVVCLTRRSHVWTKEKIVVSPFKKIDIPDTVLTEYIWRGLDKWADKTAVVCGITNKQYTYSQIYKQSKIFGANLRKKFNVENADVIAVMLPNIPEYPIVAFGILEAGAVISTFNHLFTSYEIQKLILLSNAKLIVTLPEYQGVVEEGLKFAKKQIPIISVDVEGDRSQNTISYKEIMKGDIDLGILKNVNRNANDVAALLFSSGTTGLPKGVELTHRNIIANSEQQSTECRQHELTTDKHQDTALAILPFTHISGFGINMFHMLSSGVKLVAVRKFQPDTFTEILGKFDFNIFNMPPPMVLFIGSYPKVTSEHLKHLTCVAIGGAPLLKIDIERFQDKVNRNVYFGQVYGLTETSPLVTMSPIGFEKSTSVGFALPNVSLRVVDTEMKNLGPNEKGELLVKGPNVMKGYRNNPEANKNTFVNNEWLRTGDLVSIDEEGAVFISDRMRDLIKVKAYQVPPVELENIIKEIPNISDVAVVGIKDSKTGERPKAFIVSNDKNIHEKEIMEYVNHRVAPYKHLKEVAFVKEIPKNASGKILKRVLVEEYCKK